MAKSELINDIWIQWIDEQNRLNQLNRYSGKEKRFQSSSSGTCIRKHWFSFHKMDVTDEAEEKGKRTMRLGTAFHDDLEGAFVWFADLKEKEKKQKKKKYIYNTKLTELLRTVKEVHCEKEILIEDLNVRGFYDLVLVLDNGEVHLYDFKTIGAWGYKLKFGRNAKRNQYNHHEYQLATYGLAVEKEFGRLDGMHLWYFNKDNSSYKLHSVPLDRMNDALRYWNDVNEAVVNADIPPVMEKWVSPRMNWECDYCQYYQSCMEA